MSPIGAVEVDKEGGRVRWTDDGAAREAVVPDMLAARYDPRSERIVVLTTSSVVLLPRDGAERIAVQPPAGYAPSHFAEPEGAIFVCRGDNPDGAWWDWHFEADAAGKVLRRLGPAY